MRNMNVECITPANLVFAEDIIGYRVENTPNFIFSADIAQAIHEMWQDPIIPKVMDCSSEFYLMDSASYFFTEVLRIGTPDYTPTENDVLRARAKTTGITETGFNMGQLSIHMFDMGGQRSGRKKKWIHCFESVTSIIFCTALSDYDQVLLEEKNQNRMAESLILFESVTNSYWFSRTSIILFLNKIDVSSPACNFLSNGFKITTQQDTEPEDSTGPPFKLVRPKKQPHNQYYGYAASRAWRLQLVERHWPEALPDRNIKYYEDTAMMRSYELIRHWSGIVTLDTKVCFNPPKGCSVPPEWIALFDGDDEDKEYEDIDIPTIFVFAVCSDLDDSYEERPTQEEVDYMTKLFGHAPQWWVGCGIGD
ncbi:hypothetical protein AZE42_10386 [Rhizopogon vesiculosus]|uniref:Uncharacterized protein n=1 Tax=Rhizopogon vesiculosus TaxID=180088 RepID=A0A1J8QD66_9AGAM|nr:hypothetical protein AZE42_10386 [Rhizopogon vesiculosus]